MDQRIVRTVWLSAFGAVLVVPVLVRLAIAPSQPLWTQLSVVTGLMALSALVCAAVLPSRVRSLTRAFGIESVLDVHRFLGTASGVLVLVHLAFVVAADPTKVALLNFPAAGPAPRAATVSTLALGALIVLAVLRGRSRSSYELWRWLHITLAATVLGAGALHVWFLNQVPMHPRMDAVYTLMAGLLLCVLVNRWLWRSLLDPTSEFVVRDVRRETPTVSTLVLQPCIARHSRDGGWRFAPGQFAWLRLERSVTAQEHPFTIASSPHSDGSVEFTIRHAGDFTSGIPALLPGSKVWVDGPHGAFTSDDTVGGVVMIAGGVGITPMMSMLRTAAHRGDRSAFRLVVVAGSREDLLFRAELADLRRQLDLEVTEVLRRPPAGWSGHTGEIGVGLLTAVLAGVGNYSPSELDYFLCGPPSLVLDAFDALDALDVPPDRIHTEQFEMA